MRSKGADSAPALEGDPPEDGNGISSSVPSGGISRWEPNSSTGSRATDLLYVNLEENFPLSPPFLERDPNMSSTARYSPIHGTPVALPILLPLPHTPLMQPFQENMVHHSKSIVSNMLCDDSRNILNVGTYPLSPNNNPNIDDIHPPDITQYINSLSGHVGAHAVNTGLQNERLAPLLNAIDDVSCSDDVTSQNDANGSFYPQQVFTPGNGYGVSNSNDAVYLPSSTVSSSPATQILDPNGDMHLVFSTNEFHMIERSTMKQVELLITNNEGGISYSFTKENGFIIARPTENTCNTTKNEDIKYESQNIQIPMSELHNSTNFNPDQSVVIDPNSVNLDLGIVPSEDMHNPDNIERETALNDFDIANYLDQDDLEISTTNRRDRKQVSDADISITCIPDKSVPCRAKASLPISHLWLYESGDNESSILGVYARRRIPAQARFGPLEGIRQLLLHNIVAHNEDSGPQFYIHTNNGDFSIDISDERMSNWMRYVRFSPGTDQNVCVQQLGDELYFTTSKPISPDCELILGYGVTYARRWGLPLSEENKDEVIEWPCFECPMQFMSSIELQDHLNSHDEIDKSSLRKVKKKITKKSAAENHCDICNRTFSRSFNLKQHMKTHITGLNSFDKNNKQINRISDINQTPDSNTPSQINLKCMSINDWTSDDSNSNEDIQYEDSNLNESDIIMEEPKCQCVSNENSCQYCMTKAQILVPPKLEENIKIDMETFMKCLMCTEKFKKFTSLIDHLQTEHQFDLQTFVNSQSFNDYINIRDDGTLECPICDEDALDFTDLKKHIMSNHDNYKYRCEDCNLTFDTEDLLQQHDSIKHKKQKDFSCPNCNKIFKRKDKLKEHITKQQRFINNNKEVIYLCSERINNSNIANQEDPASYLLYTFKCHPCKLGFKRRGMLVNHLARRHPEVSRASVPELQLPIVRIARDYFCQHCDKVYQSSSKRKAHILKNHPGESLPPSSRNISSAGEKSELEAMGFSACVGSVTSVPHHCPYTPCHKQYASKAKLSQHIRNKHIQADSKENSNIDNQQSMMDIEIDKVEENCTKMLINVNQNPNVTQCMVTQSTDESFSTTQDDIVSSSSMKTPPKKLPPLQHTLSLNKTPPIIFNITSNGESAKNQNKINEPKSQIIRLSKSDSDSALILESLRNGSNFVHVIHIPEHPDNKIKDTPDLPKLHISGHILSLETNKLPPMSVLSKNTIIGNILTTQYTDR